MVYLEKPTEFQPAFEVVSCYLECDGLILLLHRRDHKPEGGLWGLPAGKIDPGENMMTAMIREVSEETGYKVASADLVYLQQVYVKYPNYHFIYHMFKAAVPAITPVLLSESEHQDFRWLTPRQALDLNLVNGLSECLKLTYQL